MLEERPANIVAALAVPIGQLSQPCTAVPQSAIGAAINVLPGGRPWGAAAPIYAIRTRAYQP
eukprot:1156954-Pelagomonas_calceolata.AAC.4